MGSVAFGNADYFQLGCYFSLIFGISTIIYVNLFHTGQTKKSKVSIKGLSSPVPKAKLQVDGTPVRQSERIRSKTPKK